MTNPSISNKLIEDNYKLSLKFFMNKNFEKSLHIIKELYLRSLIEFRNELLSESLFIKIINLYIIEIGLILKNNESFLPSGEREQLIKDLINDRLEIDITENYGSENLIPYECLYNLYLVYFINEAKLNNNNQEWLLTKFRRIYSILQFNSSDKFLKKLVDLYIFEVLPKYDQFNESISLIKTNSVYQLEIDNAINRLNKIKEDKLNTEKLEKQRQIERENLENELKRKELQRAKEMERQNNLTYKSIKEIKNQYSKEVISSKQVIHPSVSDNSINTIDNLKERLFYLFKLTKTYFKENSTIILIILIILVTSSKFVNFKRINFKEKLKETIQMAVKISYL